jgi:nucleoside-triphosphatase THEP1
VLATAAGVLARGVDADRVLGGIARMGLERTGLVLGLALNSLPRIAETTSEVWLASAMRSRGPLDHIRRVPALGEVLLAHTARIADEAAAAAALRGHRALTASRTRLAVAVRSVVVTGTTNCGKTGAVVAAMEGLSKADVAVAGFIQTAVWEGNQKTGFEVADVARGGSTTTIATRVGPGRGQHGTAFVFHEGGFEAARTALQGTAAGSVLVVDELGPVELRGGGHLPAVKEALRRPDLGGFVVVVRRSLVPSLLAALEATDATIVDVEHHGARSAAAILDALGETPAS